MASPSTTINANLNINAASVKSAQRKVQSAFNNINLSSKKVSEFSNSLGRITGQASEFKKSMDAATARVFAFGATATVINGISQSFKALVASTIDVEKRLIEINSIFGATEKQFAAFRKSIFEVAKNTGQAFTVVADGAAELARQGLSAEETAKRLNASLILTRVSGLDAVSSVNSLTAALNGFTSAGLTAESVVNKIIAVDTAFAVSAKDLAEGFQRAGSTAEDAGVSFDELLGLITSVQQKTARGGAVIGNAFKSIFTRLSRGTTISELQDLGVEIDASQSGVQKLQALSDALEKVADPTVASKIKELAGGVFQINVVSAALKDLSSQTSIFADAAARSASASNEAFSKNEALNKSLSAQINALVVGTTNLAEKLGQLTLGPVISDLTSLATKLTEFLNSSLSEDDGNALIKGFFRGISAFIQGPGIILVTGAFLNIFKIVAKFAKEGFQDLLRIGSGQEKIKSIEAGIVQLLSQDATLRKQLVSTTLTQAQKEQLVIQAIQRENALLREQQAILAQLAASAARAGVTGFGAGGGFSGKKGKGFSGGFVPNFAVSPQEEAMERVGAAVHGYKAGRVKKGRIFDGSGGSFTGVFNTAEKRDDFVNAAGFKATMITPPNGFAQGFVPNFNLGSAGVNQLNAARKAAQSSPKGVGMLRGQPYKLSQIDAEIARRASQSKLIGSKENRLRVGGSNEYPFLVPSQGAVASGNFQKRIQGTFKRGKDTVYYTLTDGAIRAFSPNLGGLDQAADPHDAKIQENIESSLIKGAFNYAQLLKPLGGNKSSEGGIKDRLNVGAVNAAVGTAFEAAVLSAIDATIDIPNARFDVPSFSNSKELIDLFNLPKQFTKKAADLKATGSKGNIDSFVAKLASAEGTGVISQVGKPAIVGGKTTKGKTTKGRAAGYIPNFSTSNKGVPISKIRFHQDKDGRSFITNTRDEPNGALDVPTGAVTDAINRERQGISMFSGGFVPNFIAAVPNNPQPSSGSGNVKEVTKDLDDLDKGAKKTSMGLSNLAFAFSFGVPIITDIAQRFNKASKEAEDLSNKSVDLENALKTVNKETQPELYADLEKKIRANNKALEEAEKQSQSFTDTLNITTSVINSSVFVLTQYSDGIKKIGAAMLASNVIGATPARTATTTAATTTAAVAASAVPLPVGGGKLGKFGKIFSPLTKIGPAFAKFGSVLKVFAAAIGKFALIAGPLAIAAAALILAGKGLMDAAKASKEQLKEEKAKISNLAKSEQQLLLEQSVRDANKAGLVKEDGSFDPLSIVRGTSPLGNFLIDLPKVINDEMELKDAANPFDEFGANAVAAFGAVKALFADENPAPFIASEIEALQEAVNKNPFEGAKETVEKALEDLPKAFDKVNLGDKLSIAFRSQLEILEQSVARGGRSSTLDLRKTGLQELASSGVANLMGENERANFNESIRKRTQRLDLLQEIDGIDDFGEVFKQGQEERRQSTVRGLQEGLVTEGIKDVDLSRVDANEAQALADELSSRRQTLFDNQEIIQKALAGGPSDETQKILDSLTEEQRKSLESRGVDLSQKLTEDQQVAASKLIEDQLKTTIDNLDSDISSIQAAGNANQAALDSSGQLSEVTRALTKVAEANSVDDIEAAQNSFKAALQGFKDAGGTDEGVKDLEGKFKEVLQANADRLQNDFAADRKERERIALQEIESRTDLIASQRSLIESFQQNFKSSAEAFEDLSDPNEIVTSTANFGNASARFEDAQRIGLQGQAAAQFAIAADGEDVADIIARGSTQQTDAFNKSVFGAELADLAQKVRVGATDEDGNLITDTDVAAVQGSKAVQDRLNRTFTRGEQQFADELGGNVDFNVNRLFKGGITSETDARKIERLTEDVGPISSLGDVVKRKEDIDTAQQMLADLKPTNDKDRQLIGQMSEALQAQEEQLIKFAEMITAAGENPEDLMKEENEVRREGIAKLKKRFDDEAAVLKSFMAALQDALRDLGVVEPEAD